MGYGPANSPAQGRSIILGFCLFIIVKRGNEGPERIQRQGWQQCLRWYSIFPWTQPSRYSLSLDHDLKYQGSMYPLPSSLTTVTFTTMTIKPLR